MYTFFQPTGKSFTLLMLTCISVREKCTVFFVTDRVVPKTIVMQVITPSNYSA